MGRYLTKFSAETFRKDVLKEFQSSILDKIGMRKWLIRDVNLVLFCIGQPFSKDI